MATDSCHDLEKAAREKFQGTRAFRADSDGDRRVGLRRAHADPGAGDSRAPGRSRRDRPGTDGNRQDGGVRPAAPPVPGPGVARAPGHRPHADARALHPGDAGTSLLRGAHGHRGRRRLRRPAHRPAGASPSRRRPGRGRDRRADEGPDLPPHRRPHRRPLRRPGRSGRDARPRLHRGRREDPSHLPERPPDSAFLGHDAASDREARRALHVRPGNDQHHAEEAHGRRDRAGLRRGRRQGQDGAPPRGAQRRGAGAGDHLLPHEDRLRAARQAASRPGPALQGASRRPLAGPARRRDDPVQGAQAALAGGDRRRGARARHRARHPRHQLRPAEQRRDLRPPHRPHRPGRAHRPRDHVRDAGADGGHPGLRAAAEDRDRRVGAARGAPEARPAPAQARPLEGPQAQAREARAGFGDRRCRPGWERVQGRGSLRRTAPSSSSTAATARASSRTIFTGRSPRAP